MTLHCAPVSTTIFTVNNVLSPARVLLPGHDGFSPLCVIVYCINARRQPAPLCAAWLIH